MQIGDVVYYCTIAKNLYEGKYGIGIIIEERLRDYKDLDPERVPSDMDIDFLILWSSGNIQWVSKALLKLQHFNFELGE